MQLYAFDESNRLTLAAGAKKQRSYRCPECGTEVRMRRGHRRQAHFFHLTHNRECRQSGKSLTHLAIQNHLQNVLPNGETALECRFPEIRRIADVVWLPKRVIFEVQCSPISADEVLSRNLDYESQGFQVIWILHERRFGRWRATAAEEALVPHPHYFTNIDQEGRGLIFDQISLLKEGTRRFLSPRSEVDLSKPRPPPYPSWRRWPLSFAGDCSHHTIALNADSEKPIKSSRFWWYSCALRILLARASNR